MAATGVLGAALAWRLRAPDGARPVAAGPPASVAAGQVRVLSVDGAGELDAALGGLGVPPGHAAQAASALRGALPAGARGPLTLRVSLAPSGPALAIARIELRTAGGDGVLLVEAGGALKVTRTAAALSARLRVVRGELDAESFFSSAVAAGLHDTLVPAFTKALSFDFDLQREVAPGDPFEAVFEETIDAQGQPYGARRLLFVSLRHTPAKAVAPSDEATAPQAAAKFVQLYAFAPPDAGEDEPRWFDANGRETRRALMRTPVDGARITSGFGTRVHPISGFIKTHKGIDFAAPVGTPVYASGDGVVDYAGEARGYGTFLRLRHGPALLTCYGHLSAFAPGVATGARVRQGQVVALSGNTGASTGPHLHYEVVSDGEAVDPATFVPVGAAAQARLPAAQLAAFYAARDRVDAARAAGI